MIAKGQILTADALNSLASDAPKLGSPNKGETHFSGFRHADHSGDTTTQNGQPVVYISGGTCVTSGGLQHVLPSATFPAGSRVWLVDGSACSYSTTAPTSGALGVLIWDSGQKWSGPVDFRQAAGTGGGSDTPLLVGQGSWDTQCRLLKFSDKFTVTDFGAGTVEVDGGGITAVSTSGAGASIDTITRSGGIDITLNGRQANISTIGLSGKQRIPTKTYVPYSGTNNAVPYITKYNEFLFEAGVLKSITPVTPSAPGIPWDENFTEWVAT